MNNTEENKGLLTALLIFLLAGALVMLVGNSLLKPTDEPDPQEDSLACFASGEQVYRPKQRAELELELAENVSEKGCIVVLPADEQTAGGAGQGGNYYHLPLNDSQQDKVNELCLEFDLPPELAFGIIAVDFEIEAHPAYESSPHSILHPNPESAAWYMEHYGLFDMNDFETNARLGVIMLSEYYHRYPDVNKIAMCYELGESRALELWSAGVTQTEYSCAVALGVNTLERRDG